MLQVYKIPHIYKSLLKRHKKCVPHLILPPVGRCQLSRLTITTPLARASLTRDSSRPKVWAVDNRGFSSPGARETLTSFHVLFGVIFLECLGVLTRDFGQAVDWTYVGNIHTSPGLRPHAHHFKRRWSRDPNAGFQLCSSSAFFTEGFTLPKSGNFTWVYNLTELCFL